MHQGSATSTWEIGPARPLLDGVPAPRVRSSEVVMSLLSKRGNYGRYRRATAYVDLKRKVTVTGAPRGAGGELFHVIDGNWVVVSPTHADVFRTPALGPVRAAVQAACRTLNADGSANDPHPLWSR